MTPRPSAASREKSAMPVCRLRDWTALHPLPALLLALCLGLPGCSVRLPDSGTLPPVRAHADGTLHIEITGTGMGKNALAAAIWQELQPLGGEARSLVDIPDSRTLVVRVEMEEPFYAGKAGMGLLDSLLYIGAGAILFGAIMGIISAVVCSCATLGAIGGAIAGAAAALDMALESWSNDVWAMRVRVGMALGKTPDDLTECVISTGEKGVSSREQARNVLEKRLAGLIRQAVRFDAPPPEARPVLVERRQPYLPAALRTPPARGDVPKRSRAAASAKNVPASRAGQGHGLPEETARWRWRFRPFLPAGYAAQNG